MSSRRLLMGETRLPAPLVPAAAQPTLPPPAGEAVGSSLRRRLVVGVAGMTSVVVLVAVLGCWLTTRAVLMGGIDRELVSRSDRMRHVPIPGGGRHRPGRDSPPPGMPGPPATSATAARPDDGRLMQVLDAATRAERFRSPTVPEGACLAPPGSPLDTPFTQTLADGRRVRTIVRAAEAGRRPMLFFGGNGPEPGAGFRPGPGMPPPEAASSASGAVSLSIQAFSGSFRAGPEPAPEPVLACMGIDLAPIDGELNRLAVVLGSAWLAATVLALAAVAMLATAILRPLHRLAAAIGGLGPDDLAARLPAGAGPREAERIVERLNRLLDRLEQAFRREQTTIAHLAHELRTPVATLRSDIEFRMLAATDVDEQATLRANLATVERMQAMVSNLLLARIEAGKEPLEAEDFDLAGLVDEVAESWAARAADRGQNFRLSLPDSASVRSSALHWRVMLDNLLGNAVAHGSAGEPIEVVLASADGRVGLTVENPFVGTIDAGQLGQAFYRADAARSRGDHSGLGLALCQRLARLLGLRFEAYATAGRFGVRLTCA